MSILADPPADPIVNDPPAADPPVSSDPPADPPASDPPADPPVGDPPADDWRATHAGEDPKMLKFLGKYTDPKAAFADLKKKNDALLQRAASKLPDNPTDEEVAAYRKEQGIPDKPEGYLETLPSGLVVGDDDKPAVDQFVKSMHAANAPKGAVDAALQTYYDLVDAQEVAQIERAKANQEESADTLKEEWGRADYTRNVNAVKAMIATMPEETSSAIIGGTDDNGLPLADNPHVIRWLAGLALEANPLSTVVPGAGSNQAAAVADEIAKLEAMMGDSQGAYWKGPEAAKNQARFLELATASEKLKARG